MGHKIMNGKVITSPDTTTPSGNNDHAAQDAHSNYDIPPNHMASAVFVSAEEWAEFVQNHGGETAYGRQLEAESHRLKREGQEVKLALVFMGARLVSADPSSFQKGAGNLNKSKLAEALGLSANSRSLVTTVGKGVEAVLAAGAPLFGEPSAEVVALALDYAVKDAEHKRRSAARSKSPGEAEAEASSPVREDDGTSTESTPLVVADLVAALEAAHKVLDGLGADRDGDEWATVAALVDSLSDKVYA